MVRKIKTGLNVASKKHQSAQLQMEYICHTPSTRLEDHHGSKTEECESHMYQTYAMNRILCVVAGMNSKKLSYIFMTFTGANQLKFQHRRCKGP